VIPVIALFGLPAVGKTTTAKKLADLIHAKTRHCGDIVKAKAKELGVGLDGLSLQEHRKIDADTRNIVASAREPLVVEGRFLSEVLAGLPNVVLVNLICSEEERARRQSTRRATGGSLREQDVSCGKLRDTLYGDVPKAAVSAILINTDGHDIDGVAKAVLQKVSRHSNDKV